MISLKKFHIENQINKKYCTMERQPFYDIAKKYLPDNQNKYILDIGSGNGAFAKYLQLHTYPNTYLLDGNKETLKNLKNTNYKILEYRAPNPLPFKDESINFIHSSHMIEHLYHEELYIFLNELNRVLEPEGVLIISAPLLWEKFYEDLSHVKPYNPGVIISYLCQNSENRSALNISSKFIIVELIYRHYAYPILENIYSDRTFVNWILDLTKKTIKFLKINSYINNGYTLVLKKS